MMPRNAKKKTSPARKKAGADDNYSTTICALCGQIIKGTRDKARAVIYSVCSGCKRMPRVS
jgi:trans-2-enoyl-CoA reductase